MSSISAVINSSTQPLLGLGVAVTVALTGGTAWTNGTGSNPLVITGGYGAFSMKQTVSGGNSCVLLLQTGLIASTITITDSVNGSACALIPGFRIPKAVTGTWRYINAGLRQPKIQNIVQVGSPNEGKVYYQVVAHNAAGHTAGMNVTQMNAAGVPYGNANGCMFMAIDPTSYDGSSTGATITCGTVNNATSYDLWRSIDGSTWKSVILGQAAVAGAVQTFTDLLASATSGTMPTSNTTAIGSDSNTGLSLSQGYATGAKAASVAVAGDGVIINGFTSETTSIEFADGVAVIRGNNSNRQLDGIWSTYTDVGSGGTAGVANFSPPSGSDISHLTIDAAITDGNYRFVFGWAATNTPAVDVNVDYCDIVGVTDALYFDTAGSGGVNFFHSSTTGNFDNFNDTGNGATSFFNFTDHQFKGIATGQYTTTTGFHAGAGGHWFRECDLLSTRDSTDQNLLSVGLQVGVNAVVGMTNCTVHGGYQDIKGGTSTNLWLQNTNYDPGKSTSISTNITSIDTFIPNPLIGAVGGGSVIAGATGVSIQGGTYEQVIASETATMLSP